MVNCLPVEDMVDIDAFMTPFEYLECKILDFLALIVIKF